jgi:hypothetical protein
MRSVFKGDGSQSATPADLALPETAAGDLIRLASRPLNKRTKHFADLLLTVARASEASRGQAMRAVSRQLLRETEHRDTTLADGSRILEYYFDHQLATRVVLPASTRSKRRIDLPKSSGSTPFGLTTEVIGETCTEGCEGAGVYDPVYDAELWVTVAWYADQTEAMIDLASVEGDGSGLYLVIYEKKCIGEIGSWASSVFSIGFGIGKLSEGWATISLITKQGGVIGLGSMFAGAVNAWNNMHNCFHP